MFHVVLLVLAGGPGLVVVGAWVVVPIVIGVVAYVGMIRRGRYPDLVAGVDRMGAQLTELYASLEEANRRSEDAGPDPEARPDGVEPLRAAMPTRDTDVGPRAGDT